MIATNGGPPLTDDVRMTYVTWYIRDFLQGVRGMKLAEIGAYTMVLMHLYETMGDLPDDDRRMAIALGVDIRTWRPAKARLLELGKISIRNGRIYNKRVEDEITAYCAKVRKAREAAEKREADKKAAMEAARKAAEAAALKTEMEAQEAARKAAAGARVADAAKVRSAPISAEITAELQRTSIVHSQNMQQVLSQIDGDLSEKPNKNNESDTRTVASALAEPCQERGGYTDSDKEREKKIPTPLPPPVLGDGEVCVGGRVVANGVIVRHPGFTLSIEGIAMQLATANIGLSLSEARKVAREAAIAHALQWGAEIDAGKLVRDVVPSSPANFIRGSIVSQANKSAAAKGRPAPPRQGDVNQKGWVRI